MTTSTTFDMTRIAALPGAPGTASALHLEEGAQTREPVETTQAMPPEVIAALVRDHKASRARALRALDNAECHLPERPKFFLRLTPPDLSAYLKRVIAGL